MALAAPVAEKPAARPKAPDYENRVAMHAAACVCGKGRPVEVLQRMADGSARVQCAEPECGKRWKRVVR